MAVQQLPTGRWRATVIDPSTGKRVSAAKVLGLAHPSFPTERAARDADRDARRRLETRTGATSDITVREWWERWTTDPLFARPKDSSMIHYADGTRAFVEQFGAVKLAAVDRAIVTRWLAGGTRNWTVRALRVMFGDATKKIAGELVPSNPFARLELGEKAKGNAEVEPPDEATVSALIDRAWQVAPPGYAAWLQVACWSGMRPGELDALRWSDIDFEGSRIHVRRALNRTTRRFDKPKNGRARVTLLLPEARDALMRVRGQDDTYCFVNLRNDHWTPGGRHNWWVKVRSAGGYTGTLYLATRHFAGHYFYEVLRNPAEDVAVILGHRDKGKLVRELYGHHNERAALDRVMASIAVPARTLKIA